MSTFQERILAASGSSSGTADTDPELYRYRSASSEEYLESCNYRVWSTELPDRFLVWWMRPSDATKPNSSASNASSAPTRSRRSISRWKSS